MSREWALLQAKKQFGYGPQWREAPGNGDLAHFCPACPQPGVNIPADWEVDDRKQVDTLFTGIRQLNCFGGTYMPEDMSWMATSMPSK